MSKGNTWQHRKADTIEERFGLLDKPTSVKYKKQPIFQEPEGSQEDRELTAFGITSGVGSMLIGAKQLGFKVVGNVEWRDYYRYRQVGDTRGSTFIRNFPGAYIARGLDDVPSGLLPGTIDFAAGHPECGRYSGLSRSVSRGSYKESRGDDVSDLPLFLKLVARLRPRFFLMDDLPDSFGPLPMEEYVRLLPDYDLFPEWISNWAYGNVQKHRNRMFIVGALKSEKFTFVPGEADHPLVLRDVISDLVDLPEGVANQASVNLDYAPPRYVNLRHYGDSPTWRELQEIFKGNSWQKNLKYYTPDGEEKLRPGTHNPKWDGYCPVLSGGYNPLHPVRLLPLTVRERARIQGFPDDFVFYHDEAGPWREHWEPYGTDGQRGIKQTGKAMPIQFCRFVADQVKHHIEGQPFEASGERVLKPNPKVSQAKIDFCNLSGYADQDAACNQCWMKTTCDLRETNSI